VPAFRHVFIVVMENLGYQAAMHLPHIAQLADQGAVATDYHAVAHPSLPNYLALTSGHTWVTSDCTGCLQAVPNLAQEATAHGISWGAYMQGLPRACFLGAWWLPGLYAGKHDPFRYYMDVRTQAAQCARIQPLATLEGALPGGKVPQLVWITPNLCNDMHSCPRAIGDRWLAAFVPQILSSPAWRQGGVLFITWDEAAGSDTTACCGLARGGGHVLTLVFAPGIPAGRRVSVPYDHYSLLATVEDAFHLPLLGAAGAPGTRPLTAFWQGTGSGAAVAAGAAGPA
jgi:acid phosphatase